MAQQPKPRAHQVQKDEFDDVIGIVQGQMPDSKNEWFVALALEKLDLFYIFQFELFGGADIRGGQVIDFVVWNPNPIPVFIQGEYWHNVKSEMEDILKQAAAEQYFHIKPVVLLGEETDTKEKAYKAVVEKVR